MKLGFGQLICLISGAFLLSIGGGLIGGRLAVQKYLGQVSGPPIEAVTDSEGSPTGAPSPAFSAEPEQSQAPADISANLAVKTNDDGSAPPPQIPTRPISPTPAERAKDSALATSPPLTPSAEAPPSKYVIQALSTLERRDARSAREKIRAEGFPAGIFPADLGKKGKWFRVCVGPYESEGEAHAALEAIRDIPEFRNSFVKPLE